jgi:hypothetical protein
VHISGFVCELFYWLVIAFIRHFYLLGKLY